MNDVALLPENPVAVLTDAKTYSEFYAKMKAECDLLVPDTSTVKGRGEIRAQAFKVTRTKTAIDDAGKKLNEEAREKINAVDASRRKIREELDALADQVRKPLTEWEDAEKKRADEETAQRLLLNDIVSIPRDASAQYIADTIGDLRSFVIDPDIFRDATNEVVNIKQAAIASLEVMHATAIKAEADAAELARLRAEAESRDIAERDRIEREQAAQSKREFEDRLADQIIEYIKEVRMGFIGGQPQAFGILLRELEIKINLDDYAERHRATIKAARDEAHTYLTSTMEKQSAERAKHEEAGARRREQEAADKARTEALEKSKREHAEQMAKIEAENRRLADAETARLAAEERTKREELARQADRKHRGEIMGAAKAAMMELGATEEIAKKIVLAIVAGEIPAVTLRF